MTSNSLPDDQIDATLSLDARNALAEARLRRAAQEASVLAPEINGPKGAEPTRFGDWEKKGITSDF